MKNLAILFLFVLIPSTYSQENPSIDTLKTKLGYSDSLDAVTYLKLIKAYRSSNYDSANHYANLCESSPYVQSYPRFKAAFYKQKGYLEIDENQFVSALDNFQKALNIHKSLNNRIGMGEVYSAIGWLHHQKDNDSLMVEYFYKALYIAKQEQDTLFIADCFSDLGLCYRKSHPDSALNYFTRSEKIFEAHHRYDKLASCHNNMAILFSITKKYKPAVKYYLKSLAYKQKVNDFSGQGKTLNNLAFLTYVKSLEDISKDKKKALLLQSSVYADSSLKVLAANNINSHRLKRNAYATLLNVYYELKEYKKAMDYQTQYMQAKDSLYNIATQKQIQEMESKYQLKEKQTQIEKLEKEKQLEKARKTILLTLAALAIIVILGTMFFIQYKRKKDQTIFQHELVVMEQKKQLAEADLEKSKCKQLELTQANIYKSKQLSTHALNMLQKNTLLQEIKSELKSTQQKGGVIHVQKIKHLLDQSLSADDDWQLFKHYFEDVNQGFYEKLNSLNSDLTTADQKVCALIKLNMSTKEIASVLNVIPNSVKSARYRIKKKLGLNPELDLEDFIKRLN